MANILCLDVFSHRFFIPDDFIGLVEKIEDYGEKIIPIEDYYDILGMPCPDDMAGLASSARLYGKVFGWPVKDFGIHNLIFNDGEEAVKFAFETRPAFYIC